MTVGVVLLSAGAVWEAEVFSALDSAEGLAVLRRCLDVTDLEAYVALGTAFTAVIAERAPGVDRWWLERVNSLGVHVVLIGRAESGAGWAGLPGVTWLDEEQLDEIVAAVSLSQLVQWPESPAPQGSRPSPADPDDDEGSPRGTVMAIWSAPGAPGRSTVAAGLAHAWQQSGVGTFVLDLDVRGGSQAVSLGVGDDASGLLAVARAWHQRQVSAATVAASAVRIPESFRLLSGLPRQERWLEVPEGVVTELLEAARRVEQTVLVDLADAHEPAAHRDVLDGRYGVTNAVLAACDELLMVATPDPVGLSRLLRRLHDLAELDCQARPVVVFNRVPRATVKNDVATAVARLYGEVEMHWLPLDSGACERAMAYGVPVSQRRGSLGTALHRLARDLKAAPVRAKR